MLSGVGTGRCNIGQEHVRQTTVWLWLVGEEPPMKEAEWLLIGNAGFSRVFSMTTSMGNSNKNILQKELHGMST